jgi:hypothetical protein
VGIKRESPVLRRGSARPENIDTYFLQEIEFMPAKLADRAKFRNGLVAFGTGNGKRHPKVNGQGEAFAIGRWHES